MKPVLAGVLHLLGPLRWSDPQGVRPVPSSRLAALLGTVFPRWILREEAARLLWPDCPPSGALSNLRAGLSRLAGGLPEGALEIEGPRLRINPLLASTDLAMVREASEALFLNQVGGDLGVARELVKALEEDPLPGLPDEWAQEFRASWLLESAQILSLCSHHLERAGRHQEALAASRRGLEQDPLDERLQELHSLAVKRTREQALGVGGRPGPSLEKSLGSLLARLLTQNKPAAQEILACSAFREEVSRHPSLYLEVLLKAVEGSSLESLAAQRCMARAGLAASLLGNSALSVQLGERALLAASHLPLVKAIQLVLAFDYHRVGREEEAWEAAEAALAACEALGDHRDAAAALAQKGALLLMAGKAGEALEPLSRASAYFAEREEEDGGRDGWIVRSNLGLACLHLGREEEAWEILTACEKGLASLGTTGFEVHAAGPLAWLASTRLGQAEGARRMSRAIRRAGLKRIDRVAPWAASLLDALGYEEVAGDLFRLALRLATSSTGPWRLLPADLAERGKVLAALPRSKEPLAPYPLLREAVRILDQESLGLSARGLERA